MTLPIASAAHVGVLAAMITPAFFLTATGAMLGAANQRLARVVDRMREDLSHRKDATEPDEVARFERQVTAHRVRSELVLLALRQLYGAMTCFVATSLAIAINSFSGYRLDFLPVGLAILGSLMLFGASVCLGREAKLAMRSLNAELDRYR